jgi:uncharacterized protein (UPF0332 family)
VSSFWDKGREAARSARLLIEIQDPNGAVNRGYFAMFHVARASLAEINPDLSKTNRHATIIGRFGRHIVRERGLDPAFGRSLSLAFDLRTIADYEPVVVEPADAREHIQDMEAFLQAVATFEQGSGE